MDYVPNKGNLVWITLTPQAGREQAGRRPALVLSPASYNRRAGLALVCPITSQIKGYPYEVQLPDGLPISGVVLADQIKSVDWAVRQTEFIADAPHNTLTEVIYKVGTLLFWATGGSSRN